MVKATVIGELGWAVENMLNRVIDKTISASPEVLDVVQEVVKLLPGLVNEYSSHQQHERADVNYFAAAANALADKQQPPKRAHDQVVNQLSSHSTTDADESASEEAELPAITTEVVDSTPSVEATDNHPTGDNENPLAIADTQQTETAEQTSEIKKNNLATSTDTEFDVELIDIFIAEAKTHMQALRIFLTSCERSLPQQVTDAVQRAMHTLKGSAAMAGIDVIANIARPFEGFLKECNINGWPIQRTDLELLQDAYSLLNKGIRQLELHSLAPVEGTTSLVERINARRDYLFSQLEISSHTHDEIDDPSSLISLLLQDVDLLLDAEDHIKAWQDTADQDFALLPALSSELQKISTTANQAGFSQIANLCNALLHCYSAIQSDTLVKDKALFSTLSDAHQALLNAIDQLAAAQVVTDHPEVITRLEQLTTNTQIADIPSLPEQITDLTPEEIEPVQEDPKMNETPSVTAANPTELPAAMEPSIPETDEPMQSSHETAAANFTAEDKLILGAPAPAGPIIATDDDIDPDMVEIFLEEADEILVESKQNLDRWLTSQNSDYLHSLQRQLHTLKGGARMCGARSLGDLAHGLEFIYEGLLNGQYQYSDDLVKLLTASHDFIQLLIDNLHDNQPLPFNAKLMDAIQTFRKDGHVSFDEASLVIPKPAAQPEPAAVEEIIVPSTLEQIAERTTEHQIASQETDAHVEPLTAELIEEPPINQQTSQVVSEPAIDLKTTGEPTETKPLAAVIPLEKKATSVELRPTPVAKTEAQGVSKDHIEAKEQIKVASELLDNLVNLAGETSIYRSRVEQQNSDLATTLLEMDSTIDRVRDQLRRLDTETQAQIISKHHTENTEGYLEFDPLEMDQYSQLQQLSRSLFESASDLQDLKEP